MPDIKPPPLAVYNSIKQYTPKYGDFIMWSGLFRTWYGLVVDYDVINGKVSIAFEGTPLLLITMDAGEIDNSVLRFNLDTIRNQKRGRWYAQQSEGGQGIWYI